MPPPARRWAHVRRGAGGAGDARRGRFCHPIRRMAGGLRAGAMCLMQPPSLLVHADALELAHDPEGPALCAIATRRAKACGWCWLRRTRAEITVETATPVRTDRRYRVMPRAGSLRVFAQT